MWKKFCEQDTNEENKLRIINTGGNLPQDRESDLDPPSPNSFCILS